MGYSYLVCFWSTNARGVSLYVELIFKTGLEASNVYVAMDKCENVRDLTTRRVETVDS